MLRALCDPETARVSCVDFVSVDFLSNCFPGPFVVSESGLFLMISLSSSALAFLALLPGAFLVPHAER